MPRLRSNLVRVSVLGARAAAVEVFTLQRAASGRFARPSETEAPGA